MKSLGAVTGAPYTSPAEEHPKSSLGTVQIPNSTQGGSWVQLGPVRWNARLCPDTHFLLLTIPYKLRGNDLPCSANWRVGESMDQTTNLSSPGVRYSWSCLASRQLTKDCGTLRFEENVFQFEGLCWQCGKLLLQRLAAGLQPCRHSWHPPARHRW